MRRKSTNRQTWSEGKTKVIVKQSSKATIGQGGNAFSINASEVAVVRIRPGQQ
ncbi:hypothetical protein [Paenibacillus radicis (ex Xue et al. 2023)]|uniref:Uncharacterized protein n=1 Tax=Paenibacillus radicis (ex Xue et al. 2023) TaxID=2972489 RepID=A0ABT1YN81_9BACL|nr:hypothetical protein [Paenibacillus radicis (ex Xue et al. 2023)]MCR8634629.1 hypothetical protein [Paenibacillus radicis (ex Xue et al. 2023)]